MAQWDALEIRGLSKTYASRLEQGYDMEASIVKVRSKKDTADVNIVVHFNGGACHRSFRRSFHQLLPTLSEACFALFMFLADPSVPKRFVDDIKTAMSDWFARRLLCILRRVAFRRRVHRRVAARLVLSKSSSRLADLPAVIVRSICAEWLH